MCTPVRSVSSSQYSDLKNPLEQKRNALIKNNVGYRVLRKEVVLLQTGCIVELCKRAKYMKCEKDVECVPGLRSVFVSKLYANFID